MSVTLSSEQNIATRSHDRREGMSAIPLNLNTFLSADQRRSIKQIKSFGWHLAFVRRPMMQDPVVVIRNGESSKYSVLEADGTVNEQPNIRIRF